MIRREFLKRNGIGAAGIMLGGLPKPSIETPFLDCFSRKINLQHKYNSYGLVVNTNTELGNFGVNRFGLTERYVEGDYLLIPWAPLKNLEWEATKLILAVGRENPISTFNPLDINKFFVCGKPRIIDKRFVGLKSDNWSNLAKYHKDSLQGNFNFNIIAVHKNKSIYCIKNPKDNTYAMFCLGHCPENPCVTLGIY
jgi:hypothetical protein